MVQGVAYIGNNEFKSDDHDGRKPRPEKILHGAQPDFSFKDIQLPPADKFGVVFLAPANKIKDVAANLKPHTLNQREVWTKNLLQNNDIP
ncbi:hypothetical protein ABZV14_29650 [Streptosporangium canum]|uniref:hypothetical protein n=1 Tax=Streptosporangium canum TaxID=324952 RepID=UPI0033BA216D